MTTATRPVVTALLDGHRRYATEPGEVTDVLRAVLSGERARGAFLYVWDRPFDKTTDARPGHQMRVNLDATGQRGAINYVVEGEHGGAWDTLNPHPSAEASTVWFDATTPTPFRSSAVLPVSEIQQAVEEFVRTGRRPERVQWQQAQSY